MSKSRPHGLTFRGTNRHRHEVAMIAIGTRYHAVRRSRIGFWTTAGILGVVTAVVAAGFTTLPHALLIGFLTGIISGAAVGVVLFCWPALRVAWHWATELIALTTVLAGYLLLLQGMPSWAALAVLVTVLGGPFALPSLRRTLMGWVWCVTSRHRLRLCFAAFIASQREGSTPLILFARPIPAGERVWIWLRPGLALSDLESRVDRLAAGCWAADCRLAPASSRYAALARIDIIRRNPLGGMVGSPLSDLLPTTTIRPGPTTPMAPVNGLDLADTTTPDVEPKRRPRAVTASPEGPQLVADVVTPNGRDRDDLTDWI